MPPYSSLQYHSYVTESLTEYQRRRIRRARPKDIAKMANQDRYWSEGVLRAILSRVEDLTQVSPRDAIEAGSFALELLKRIRHPPADLVALADAVLGSALRYAGRFGDAIKTYERALAVPDLSRAGQAMVLQRMAVAVVCNGAVGKGLELVEEAISLDSDSLTAQAIRGWVLMVAGELHAALAQCIAVLERADPTRDLPSTLTTIVNAANILSYEIVEPSDPGLLERLESSITACRRALPQAGSSYYRARRPRLILSRAEALLLVRSGQPNRAVPILRRVVEGLTDDYPDDALFACADLMCIQAQLGDANAAHRALIQTSSLAEQASFRPPESAIAALSAAEDLGQISFGQAVELRALLRPN